jgi:capsular polysaccharide biosynthesis protein
MLRVRLDDCAADGTAHLDETRAAPHGAAGAHPAGKVRLTRELQLDQVFAILRRRCKLILAIAGVGTMLATILGLLVPPKYTATAQLVIETPAGSTAERAPGVTLMDETIDTHVTLLSSRDHLQRVIESLSRDPKFRPTAHNAVDPEAPPVASSSAAQPDALAQPTGSEAMETTNELMRRLHIWLGALRRSENTAVPPLEEFERNTRAIQERRSRVISVAFTSTSPEKAAAFANRIVQIYVDGLKDQKLASAIGEITRLDQRIADTKYETERAEAAAQKAIQRRHGSEPNASGAERDADGQMRELLRHAGTSAQLYDSLLRRRKEISDRQETMAPRCGGPCARGGAEAAKLSQPNPVHLSRVCRFCNWRKLAGRRFGAAGSRITQPGGSRRSARYFLCRSCAPAAAKVRNLSSSMSPNEAILRVLRGNTVGGCDLGADDGSRARLQGGSH